MSYHEPKPLPQNPEPHRGVLILTLGLLGVPGILFFSIPAWVMGNRDLRRIRSGMMGIEGERYTSTGRTLGIVGTILGGLLLLVIIAALGLGLTLFSQQRYHDPNVALAADLREISTKAIEWWLTPASLGGSGRQFPESGAGDSLARFLNFTAPQRRETSNENGRYRIVAAESPSRIVIRGIGALKQPDGYPLLEARINLEQGSVAVELLKSDPDGEF